MSLSFQNVIEEAPVLAVLRGICPGEIDAVGDALVAAGVRALEVTMDSPDPCVSIAALAQRFGDRAAIAAGTVLTPEQAAAAAEAGATAIVSPNFSAPVVKEAKRLGLLSAPGVMTPSECFAALDAGADMLKLFPGDVLGAAGVKAIRAVTPKSAQLMVTGGVSLETIGAFLKAGAAAVGLGSALYKPGKSAEAIGADAARFVAAAKEAR